MLVMAKVLVMGLAALVSGGGFGGEVGRGCRWRQKMDVRHPETSRTLISYTILYTLCYFHNMKLFSWSWKRLHIYLLRELKRIPYK